jgi:DNA-binding CsgD family transcriptional regulator
MLRDDVIPKRLSAEERQYRDDHILRMVSQGFSEREIARFLLISRSTVWDVKQKARRRGSL